MKSCCACAKISVRMVQETFAATLTVEDILSTEDKQLSSGD